MLELAYTSDARKGWDDFDRSVEWALEALGRPAPFDEVAALLPEGIHYPLILGSLRTFAECHNGRWRPPVPASVADLPSRTSTTAARKAA